MYSVASSIRPYRPSTSMDSLLVISAFLLLGWFWVDSLRAREIAIEICRAACEEHDWQFLDQTVAIRHLRLRRTDAGLRWRRVYRFDFSQDGTGRRKGQLVLLGMELETISLGLQEQPVDS